MLIPISIEMLIDAGLGTPSIYAEYERMEAEGRARWAALPWRVRFWRQHVSPRLTETRWRIGHASRALRGIECEDGY